MVCVSYSRQKEVGLALGVADELQVAVFRTERLLILLLCHSQRATQASKHRACKRLHCKILHTCTHTHTHATKYGGGHNIQHNDAYEFC